MKSGFLIVFFVVCGMKASAQECPSLIDPLNGAVNVAVDATISWNAVEGVTGYIISFGTTPGGGEIINNQPVGSSTSFTPPLGLPDDTQIYVTITLFFFNLSDIECPSETFRTEDITAPPNCTLLSNPLDAAIDINVATSISWNYEYGATEYIVTIGTAPGLGDIVNNLDVGNTLTYNPVNDFPLDTEIFVQITPYNENGSISSCTEESFTTGMLQTLPDCTTLITPQNGDINVGLTPLLEWEAVPGATGYRVFIGTTPFDNDILNGGIFFTNSTFVINLEANVAYFILIVPFNDAGDALGCQQESFSTILGCGPFYDSITGELVTLNPLINFPDQIGICIDAVPTTITTSDDADGYRWYKVEDDGDEVLISEGATVDFSDIGNYIYEAYNVNNESGITTECSSSKSFIVVSSEGPTIEGVNVTNDYSGLQIIVQVSGSGNYEYALDNIGGPYQDSNIFNNAPENTSFVYVRDKNGCGFDVFEIIQIVKTEGFPKFFTPNGDGYNDFWQYTAKEEDTFQLAVIHIFDRYGKHIISIKPLNQGWSGVVNGYKFPSSDFWYRALTSDGAVLRGHFTLKR